MSRRNTETEIYDILSEYNHLSSAYDDIYTYIKNLITWTEEYKSKLIIPTNETLHHVGKIHEGKYTSIYSASIYADPIPTEVILRIRSIKPLIRKMNAIKQKIKQDTTNFAVSLLKNRETAEPEITGRFIFDSVIKVDFEKGVDIIIHDVNQNIIDMATKIGGVKDYFIRSKILDSFIDELYSDIDSSLESMCEKIQHEKNETYYITALLASRMHNPRDNNIYL